jgi:hypothetical protein
MNTTKQARLAIFAVLALGAGCARSVAPPPIAVRPAPTSVSASQEPEAKLAAIDVFDTDPSTVERILARQRTNLWRAGLSSVGSVAASSHG